MPGWRRYERDRDGGPGDVRRCDSYGQIDGWCSGHVFVRDSTSADFCRTNLDSRDRRYAFAHSDGFRRASRKHCGRGDVCEHG
jgi:hypothetical protein